MPEKNPYEPWFLNNVICFIDIKNKFNKKYEIFLKISM
jgi:hypothetical protein